MKKRFTKKELEILKTLWNSAAPMIASEIAKANNALNLNTVHACLRSLSDKGAIKVDDIVYSGTVLTRSYVPVITSEEYFGDLYNDILGTKKENLLLRSLIDTQTDITELENLEKRINRYKDNLNQENASRLHIAIGLKLLSVILIKYQLGYEIDEIKHDVLEYIENDKQKVLYCEGNLTYDDVANLLSLAYLFDVDSEQVDFIKTKMVEEKYIDIRLDIIRNLYFEGKCYSSKGFYYRDKGYFGDFSKENGGIVDVYNAPDAERTDLFLRHLNTVKDKHHRKLVKYYESLAEDRYTYTGATDIVLTAVAKALALDMSALCDSKYIASDLL